MRDVPVQPEIRAIGSTKQRKWKTILTISGESYRRTAHTEPVNTLEPRMSHGFFCHPSNPSRLPATRIAN
jgi:hypothetical protein